MRSPPARDKRWSCRNGIMTQISSLWMMRGIPRSCLLRKKSSLCSRNDYEWRRSAWWWNDCRSLTRMWSSILSDEADRSNDDSPDIRLPIWMNSRSSLTRSQHNYFINVSCHAAKRNHWKIVWNQTLHQKARNHSTYYEKHFFCLHESPDHPSQGIIFLFFYQYFHACFPCSIVALVSSIFRRYGASDAFRFQKNSWCYALNRCIKRAYQILKHYGYAPCNDLLDGLY